MNKISILLSAFLFLNLSAQTIDSTSKKYAESITSDERKTYVYQLASDEFEGIETGKKGQKPAADYLANYFKSLEIKSVINDSYFQVFHFKEEYPTGVEIKLNNLNAEFLKDFYHFSGFENQKIVSNKILFLGYDIDFENYSDYQNIDVIGKILMILDDEPHNEQGFSLITESGKISDWSSNRWKKINYAKEKGANAVLIVYKSYDYELSNFRHYAEKTSTYFENSNKINRLPYFFVSAQMAEHIILRKPKKKSLTISEIRKKISQSCRTHTILNHKNINININKPILDISSENVLAYIPGTDLAEDLIILTAHYDHFGIDNGEIYYGADEDGSGTAALMEIAEAFVPAANEGKRPRRSILIMPVSGEEKGLLGSSFYVNFPVFPLSATIANLNIDLIGRLDEAHQNYSNYVYLIGSDKLSTELHKISENVKKACFNITLDYTYNHDNHPNKLYYRSDHYNFAKNNIPAIFHFTGIHEDYHKLSDTADKLDVQKMENITWLIFYTAWELANKDTRPKFDK